MKTSFLLVMGDYPINKTLDFLIENQRTDWSIKEISDQANIGYSTLKKLMPKLLKYDLVRVNRSVGKAKLYSINKESNVVDALIDLYFSISENLVCKQLDANCTKDDGGQDDN